MVPYTSEENTDWITWKCISYKQYEHIPRIAHLETGRALD